MNLAQSLLQWYSQNKRPLPWRETRDPYKIWLSEVILQQTRVNQGMEYYHRFLIAFPDIQRLASASEQEVLKLWQGLGYYSRARNMHYTAIEIVNKHDGMFPQSSQELKKLKGIGDYTAAAIASICYDEPLTVLDGNVARVITRLFAVETPIDTNAGRAEITSLTIAMLDNNHPGTFNQAVMELGALVCTPKSPSCDICPLAFGCKALKQNTIENFPVKTPKKTPTSRYMNYLVISFMANKKKVVLMRKRTGNDIWKNMYDFPCVETLNAIETDQILEKAEKQWLTEGIPYVVTKVSQEYIHQLSHRRIYARFIRIELSGIPHLAENITPIQKGQIAELPLPRLIDLYFASQL